MFGCKCRPHNKKEALKLYVNSSSLNLQVNRALFLHHTKGEQKNDLHRQVNIWRHHFRTVRTITLREVYAQHSQQYAHQITTVDSNE